MFDKVHITHLTPPGYVYANVTEKRAPTDESIRLLKEMETAARDKIIKSIELESNTINARVFVQREVLSAKNQYAIICDINGKRHDIRLSSDSFASEDHQIREIYKALSEEIAATIMPTLVSTVMKERLFK